MDDTTAPQGTSFSYKRLIPIGVLALGLVAFFVFDLGRFLSFEALRENRAALLNWVDTYGIVAALIYMLIYAVAIAFSLPGGAVLTITGGFLFGEKWGTVCVVFAATVGATALFLIAKTSFGDALRAKAGPALQRMQDGFQEGALSYLLVLRLVPLFPFFLVNLVPAFLGVSLRVYVVGTFIGIIPGTFVFATVGAGLGSVFDQGGEFSAAGILTPADHHGARRLGRSGADPRRIQENQGPLRQGGRIARHRDNRRTRRWLPNPLNTPALPLSRCRPPTSTTCTCWPTRILRIMRIPLRTTRTTWWCWAREPQVWYRPSAPPGWARGWRSSRST